MKLLPVILLFCICTAHAQTQPAPAPAPGSAPADPSAESWLDKIQTQSEKTKTLTANLIYDRTQGLLRDRQRRFGNLFFITGPPAKYAIHFDRLLVDSRMDQQDRWYKFDGRWLVEKLDDQKQFTAHEICPPGNEAKDPLALGEGPFAIPITANKDRILRRFTVEIIPPAEKDPENSLHLRLTPRPDQRNQFTQIDFWYDKDVLTPLATRTEDDSKNISYIKLKDVKINENIDESVLDTRPPSATNQQGWREEIKPYEK